MALLHRADLRPSKLEVLAAWLPGSPGIQPEGLATKIGRSGWRSVEWRNLTGNIVALHRAIRPA